jgi:hypothetical protein
MKLMNKLSILGLLLFIPVFSFAQISGPGFNDTDISHKINPPYPGEHSAVDVSINSSYVFLNSSMITWSINGRTIKKGIGETDVQFVTGAVGKPILVNANISTGNGETYSKNITVNPVNVDFITQAKTYTPPFYKGKALFTGESTLIVSALAEITGNGGIIDQDKLIYEWSVDDTTKFKQSGYSKKDFTFNGTMWNQPQKVTVSISTIDGTEVARKSEVFTPTKPEIQIYEDNPLLGILFNRAISSQFNIGKGKEVTFFASPYNIMLEQLSNGTNYLWKMNGKSVLGNENGNSITFRDDTGESGETNISIEVSQERNLFQRASNNFKIQFK